MDTKQYEYLAPDDPDNTQGGPGQLDSFVTDKYVSPWHDQDARMLQPYPIAISVVSVSLTQTLTMPEKPLWYLFCLQCIGAVADTDILYTIAQGGDRVTLKGVQNWFFDAAANPHFIYGPMQRVILKAHEKIVVVTLTGNTAAACTGTLFAVGAGIDPTKVGLF